MTPIKDEINVKKLNFLDHILSLEPNDPVFLLYCEQKSLPFEQNWAQENSTLFEHYRIEDHEAAIKTMSIRKWKNIVKDKVRQKAF